MKIVLSFLLCGLLISLSAQAHSVFTLHNETGRALTYTDGMSAFQHKAKAGENIVFSFQKEIPENNGISFKNRVNSSILLMIDFYCTPEQKSVVGCQHDFSSWLIGSDTAFNWRYPDHHKSIEMWVCTSRQYSKLGHCPNVPWTAGDSGQLHGIKGPVGLPS
ncbi:hypothetical protein [Dongshaea marina]|uniref:hypothetical protein n=1 Tax=Dongshaea marina TaxID=2047966 RepID=UPI000D3E7032|nr:hypothetical protein [Dongshaea marina]